MSIVYSHRFQPTYIPTNTDIAAPKLAAYGPWARAEFIEYIKEQVDLGGNHELVAEIIR